MRAAWYEKQGAARDVLVVGEMPDPEPGPAEVCIRVAASSINPGDVKMRQDAFGYGMPYPRVIPHSDGAGTIDRVDDGVTASRVGERVWCCRAQNYRPFGTAAEYVLVPSGQAVPLPEGVSFELGACVGISGISAHRCIHVAGTVAGRVVLVQGGAGAIGLCTVQLAQRAGAHEVVRTGGGVPVDEIAGGIQTLAPECVDHIVKVAIDASIMLHAVVLAIGDSIVASVPRGTVVIGAILGNIVQECPGILPGQGRFSGRSERRGARVEYRPRVEVVRVRDHPNILLVGHRRSP
jgi:NADPH2:quinone reductase